MFRGHEKVMQQEEEWPTWGQFANIISTRQVTGCAGRKEALQVNLSHTILSMKSEAAAHPLHLHLQHNRAAPGTEVTGNRERVPRTQTLGSKGGTLTG